jgi:serine/threonine protein phosphatase PrpC
VSTVTIRSAFLTDVGRVRERNEDACFAGDHVFAVADGLGGHRAGEVASDLALGPVRALDELEPKDAAGKVADAVRQGNLAVHEHAQQDEELRGMGTTMTAVVISGDTAYIAHVGDSRCYLVRGDAITQLSRDHTLVARMVSEGRLTPEQAEAHPQRSVLTRALGAERDVDVDESRITLTDGDRLVICSDGLTGMLSDEEIRAHTSGGADLEEICQGLVDDANDRGGVDNISVVLVDVAGEPGVAHEPVVERVRATRPRRFPVRLAIWVLILLVLALGGWIGVRAWTNRSFYVGVNGETVTIYRGLPVSFAGIHLSHVEEPTTMKVADVAPYFLPRLRDGIRARNLTDARNLVKQIPPASTEPSPRASPSPSPKASTT